MDKDQFDLIEGIIDALVDINTTLRKIDFRLGVLHPTLDNSSMRKIAKILETWERRT